MNTKVGTAVRQVMPAPIVGTIVEVRWNEAGDCKEICVHSSNADGTPTVRWFLESELELA